MTTAAKGIATNVLQHIHAHTLLDANEKSKKLDTTTTTHTVT